MRAFQQRWLEYYEDTGNDFCLAPLALNCLVMGEPMPEIAEQYVKNLLIEVIENKSGKKRKVETMFRHEGYVQAIRELVFLTGTTVEDAIERILYTDHATEVQDAPTNETLSNWWNNRDHRLKKPMTLERDLPLLDAEKVSHMENHYLEYSPEATGNSLRVLPEIVEQLPEIHPLKNKWGYPYKFPKC